MPTVKNMKYAQINQYNNLVVPVDLLPKILESCFLIDTTWENHKTVITAVKEISEFSVRDGEEIRAVMAQQKLSGQ